MTWIAASLSPTRRHVEARSIVRIQHDLGTTGEVLAR